MEMLMNEENEWDHKISAGVKEEPADCMKIDEVAAALKKMKRHKAQVYQCFDAVDWVAGRASGL